MQAQKVFAVAYRNESFTRGSNCKALSGKQFLVSWICGRLWAVVAYGRWSHMEVRLYVGDTGCLPFTQTTWVEIVCINIMMAKVSYLFTSFALSFHPKSTNVSEGFYNIIATKLNIHWPERLFVYFIFTNSSTATFPSRCLS